MLTLDQKWALASFGSIFYTFVFAPLFFCMLARRDVKTHLWWRDISLTVFVAWLVICTYRLFIEAPVCRAYAYSKGDFMADGVGGNVATVFLTGWLIPLIECVVLRFSVFARSRPKQQYA